jgi:hypothetical protein
MNYYLAISRTVIRGFKPGEAGTIDNKHVNFSLAYSIPFKTKGRQFIMLKKIYFLA